MISSRNTFLILIILTIATACGESSDDETVVEDGNWIKRSSFEGVARSGAVAFVIENKAYVGLGFDGDDYLIDFWSYDPDQNFWQRVADFPGVGRSGGVAFSIGGNGYIGTGYDGDAERKDFWKYNAASNTWTQINDFGGTARLRAVAFSTAEKGYVGTGFDGNYLKDFWEFDPSTEEWAQIVSVKGEKRESAVAVVADGRMFVGTGTNNGIFQTDFWEFDDANIDWIRQEDLDIDDDYAVLREEAVSFSIGEFGYVSTGIAGSNLSSTWQYDPVLDIWTEKTALEGASRRGAVAFSVNGRAYVALGQSSSSRFDDLWEFRPDEEYDEED